MPTTRPLIRDLGIGLVAGVFSGLFGVGGGIVAVPLLVFAAHLGQKRAQATSLVMIAIGAVSGATTYALSGAVAWGPALTIIVGGLIGTLIGTTLLPKIADQRLQVIFAAFLVIAAVRLVWTGVSPESSALTPAAGWAIAGYIACGVAMGLLSSLLGVGGGIILIPLLVSFFGYSQHDAAGTSLLVMIPIAVLGSIRLGRQGLVEWGMGARLGLGALVGAFAGASLALALPQNVLRIAFALLLVVTAVQMLRTSRRHATPDR